MKSNIPQKNTTATCAHTMGQDFHSLTPVRGLTLPSIPPLFHRCEEKCPKTSSQKSWKKNFLHTHISSPYTHLSVFSLSLSLPIYIYIHVLSLSIYPLPGDVWRVCVCMCVYVCVFQVLVSWTSKIQYKTSIVFHEPCRWRFWNFGGH